MSEDLPVDEVIGALEEYQRRTIDLYREHADDPEACVRALVRLHLGWTEEDPERAKMVSRYRGEVMAGPGRAAERFERRLFRTIERVDGNLPQLGRDAFRFIQRPSRPGLRPNPGTLQALARRRLKKQPTEYADAMGDAAWAGILAARAALEPVKPPRKKMPG